MFKIDNVMTDFLIALYLGLTTLLMVNIFIALLTTTFNRVYDASRAYFLLQRSIEILDFENCKKNNQGPGSQLRLIPFIILRAEIKNQPSSSR